MKSLLTDAKKWKNTNFWERFWDITGEFQVYPLIAWGWWSLSCLKFSTIPGSFAQEAGLVSEGRPEPGTFPGRRVLGSECQASRWLSVRIWWWRIIEWSRQSSSFQYPILSCRRRIDIDSDDPNMLTQPQDWGWSSMLSFQRANRRAHGWEEYLFSWKRY